MLNFDLQFISMRKLITLVLLNALFSFVIRAQAADDDYALPKKKENTLDKVSASVIAGTGLSFNNSSQNPVMGSFIASQAGYRLSSKWKLNMGMMHYSASGNSSVIHSGDFRAATGASQNNFNAASLGLEYRISDKSSIGISTGISNGNYGFPGMSPFSANIYPFGMFSPFGR